LAVGVPVASSQHAAEQVQVIAHPDDDLYFMSPDVGRFIRHGWGSTTVVVTAGEFNGSGPLRRGEYAAKRQDGLRAAYADLAGARDAWNRTAITVAGKEIERDTLVAKPHIALVFLDLPDGKDSLPGRSMALENLWKGAYASVLTVVPDGSVVDRVQTYTADDLTRVLAGLFGAAAVTIARTLDAHPDHRFEADHTDHVHSALFAEKALAAHVAATGAAVTSIAYRGYGAGGLPPNLDPATAADKRHALASYAAHDPGAGLTGPGEPRLARMYPRYLGPSTRPFHQADGRLGFAAVVSGGVRVWTSTAGAWGPPAIVDGARLAPPLAVVGQHNGRVRLFALRLDDFHLVTAEQTAANVDTFSGWLDLANRDPASPSDIGSPEAAVDGGGRVYVFVKDHAGGISARSMSAAGTWSDWETLGGSGVTESLATTVDTQGRLELYAPTPSGICQWTQPLAGAPLTLQPQVLPPVPAGRLTTSPNADGRPQLFYRDPLTGAVRTMWQTKDQTWAGPLDLGGQAGFGPLAATQAGGRIVLVGQASTYDLLHLRQSGPNMAFPPAWHDLAGAVANPPAIGTDDAGRVVIAVVGDDGALRVRLERAPGSDGDFADWLTVAA
jgi:LmbE family N-acetylglucosaminyl deacetylase